MNNRFDGHDRFQELLWGFAAHRVLTVAEKCGLLKLLLKEDGITIKEAATQCSLAPGPTGKMLRALAAMEVAISDDGKFRLREDIADLFLPDDESIAPFLVHSHNMYESFSEHLETWVRTGDWPRQRRSGEQIAVFAAAMAGMGVKVAREAAEKIDLNGVKTLLDIGGSIGHYAETFCIRNPEIEAVVLDIPEVVSLGRKRFAEKNTTAKVTFESGDYHTFNTDKKFDMVLIANVLHQETEEKAPELIAKGTSFLTDRGRLAVIDFAIDEKKEHPFVGAMFAVNMRSFGDTYSQKQIESWMADAGLNCFEKHAVGRHRWAIVGKKCE